MGHTYLKHLSWHWNGPINFQSPTTSQRHPKLKVQIKDPRERERNSNVLICILIIAWGSQASWHCERKSCFHRTKSIHGQLSIDGGVMCYIHFFFHGSWKHIHLSHFCYILWQLLKIARLVFCVWSSNIIGGYINRKQCIASASIKTILNKHTVTVLSVPCGGHVHGLRSHCKYTSSGNGSPGAPPLICSSGCVSNPSTSMPWTWTLHSVVHTDQWLLHYLGIVGRGV